VILTKTKIRSKEVKITPKMQGQSFKCAIFLVHTFQMASWGLWANVELKRY
jgi:hypothetical protein